MAKKQVNDKASQFKMLKKQVAEIVEKLGKKAPDAPNMSDVELQTINKAIDNTINNIKSDLSKVQDALSEVVKVVKGEIARRGIAAKVEHQISMFDNTTKIDFKPKEEVKVEAPADSDEVEFDEDQSTLDEAIEDAE